MDKKHTLNIVKKVIVMIVACFGVAVSYYCFVTPNNFAPGGLYGLGSMIQNKTAGIWDALPNGIPWAIPVITFSIPIMIVSFVVLDKKSAFTILCVSLLTNTMDVLLELVDFPQYVANGDPVITLFAAALGGMLSGVCFAWTMINFGTCDGTIAIAAIVKKKRPALNIAWATFAFDAIVVAASFFVYWKDYTAEVANGSIGEKIVRASIPIIFSMTNMFFVSKFCDLVMKGFSSAFKFEIVCDNPEPIAAEIMEKLGRGVTVIPAEGMFSHSQKYLLVCLVPKKQASDMKNIMKKYPNTFGYITSSSEVMGDFTH